MKHHTYHVPTFNTHTQTTCGLWQHKMHTTDHLPAVVCDQCKKIVAQDAQVAPHTVR